MRMFAACAALVSGLFAKATPDKCFATTPWIFFGTRLRGACKKDRHHP
jgi:hypothetical protein